MMQAVVEFGPAVHGNGRSGGGVDGCDKFDIGLLHTWILVHPRGARDARGLQLCGYRDAQNACASSSLVACLGSPTVIFTHRGHAGLSLEREVRVRCAPLRVQRFAAFGGYEHA